jgi:hypothetical protein
MFDSWERGELLMRDDCFHFAVYSDSAAAGGKNNLVIHVTPAPIGDWAILRERDPGRYRAEKERIADFYIRKVEEYLIPGLSEHIVLKDVSSPATYARWLGSPTGSNFDMLPVPGNFGKNRLGTRTPVKNLYLPKFSHGIWPSMQAGIQVADMISGGKIMGGAARYTRRASSACGAACGKPPPGLAQEFGVERGDGGVLVRLAHRKPAVLRVEGLLAHPSGRRVGEEGLSPAAHAAAGTGHDLHELVGGAPRGDAGQDLARVPQAVGRSHPERRAR